MTLNGRIYKKISGPKIDIILKRGHKIVVTKVGTK